MRQTSTLITLLRTLPSLPGLSLAVSRTFSGEGRGAFGDLPDCGRVREGRAVDIGTAAAELAPLVAQGGPLRGENPQELAARVVTAHGRASG
ncbi:hypothetical protein Srubr_31660 [Streptomyces rubradiris]|uniref:Uncharacterized protein n=1 Tax=Streptomyces rubradiris TaxID=285531 RepID=A0ABQ3RBU4_STRRR|nr:hypothetical protein GCM10018792_00590 [Streptomyces rubradiris]GHI53320.1 hypothetical protein Srubr_31660 [Streptomyces rubradiris]